MSVNGCVASDDLVGKELVESPVLGGDETRAEAIRIGAHGLHRRDDVEAQAGDRIGKLLSCFLGLRAVLGDHRPEHCEQEPILALEEPIERLQRDAGLLHELLRREAVAAVGDEAARRVDDRLALARSAACVNVATAGERSAARSADELADSMVGVMTATARRPGSARSVRDWYTS